MKRDHDEPAVGGEPCGSPLERDPQALEFLVDRDAQRLECPRGGMDPLRRLLSGHGGHHDAGEIAGGFDRLPLAGVGDAAGDPPAEPLLPELVDDVGERLGTEAVDHSPGRLALRGIEAEVERAIGVEREAAGVVGELVAREADVEEHAVHLLDLERVEHLGDVAEVGLGEPHGLAGELVRAPLDRGGVTVESDHASCGADRLHEQPRVAAAAEGAIDDGHALLDREKRHHLGG